MTQFRFYYFFYALIAVLSGCTYYPQRAVYHSGYYSSGYVAPYVVQRSYYGAPGYYTRGYYGPSFNYYSYTAPRPNIYYHDEHHHDDHDGHHHDDDHHHGNGHNDKPRDFSQQFPGQQLHSGRPNKQPQSLRSDNAMQNRPNRRDYGINQGRTQTYRQERFSNRR